MLGATSDFKRTAFTRGGLHMTDSQVEFGPNPVTLSKATLELVGKHVHSASAVGSKIMFISLMQKMKRRIYLQETMLASSSSNRLLQPHPIPPPPVL